jgi:hypothetical protein
MGVRTARRAAAGLRERLRSAWAGNPFRERSGREPLDIQRLVSPLRYDVLVRGQYFDFCEARRAQIDRDLDAHVAASRAHPYYVWFRAVACAIRMPELLADEAALERAFAARVRRSVALLESFRAHGYDAAEPLVLASGRRIEPTDTGKQLAGPIFTGDGCHRLALLLRAGVRRLEPSWYRVRTFRRYAPRDSTARLVAALPLDRESYFAFLSLGYASTRHTTREALLAEVRARAPERAAELEQVIARDAPLLDAAPPSGGPAR